MFEKKIQEHKPFLTAECFALEAPVRLTQPTGLTGDTGLTDVTERSDRSCRSGSVHGTGLTDDHDRSDRSPDKTSSLVFCDKNEVEDWRKPLVDYLHNPSSLVDRKTEDGLLSLFLMMVNYIVVGRGLDFISKIHPSSSKGHCFVIVSTDYFT
jgi:hypothetical protein